MALRGKNISFSFNCMTTRSPALCELVRGAFNAGASVVTPLGKKCHFLVALPRAKASLVAQAKEWGVQVWDEAAFRNAAKLPGGGVAAKQKVGIKKVAVRKAATKGAKRLAASTMKAATPKSAAVARRLKQQ
eukprot:TRINITY_DN14512_c0_g1_i1.p1 TRINITY_DN14512_c0_g1~~TRINITY_DN14512_c0_g1_i1.p1  ORF type:complete len:132 (+),score=22.49 TRINITY_DN14512_c0_g1_i1:66-461(+)